MKEKVDQIVKDLRALSNPENREGMARFGINSDLALGIRVPVIKKYAKKLGKDHELGLALWKTGIHEVRFVAGLVSVPQKVTEEQMEDWVKDFNSWDLCDETCFSLFDKTPFAYRKAIEWSTREEEFVKRAGFAIMAGFAVHDKKADDEKLLQLFPAIEKGADDNRNFVKKAVNWALRQIGKRNISLNKEAIKLAKKIKLQDTKSARWIASDAIRELESETIQQRLIAKAQKTK